MLIQLCFFVLMLFGLAALTIDMGYVRLTQAQMQNAVDTAALEGVRNGRAQARDAVRLAHGASPVIATNDTGDPLNASQAGIPSYDPDASSVYLPNPQLNTGNAVHGDLVAGSYDRNASHSEDASYVRQDFDVTGSSAFLVRLRRTDHRNPLDREPDVSSSGDALPLLFGRGTMIPAQETASGWAPRRDGITVRATAIADARPARRIGPDRVPTYAITLSFWDFLLANGSVGIVRVADSFSAPVFGVGEAGKFVNNARAVGIDIDAQPIGAGGIVDGTYYVPIYGDTNRRVIGFGKVAVALGAISRLPSEIAANASAILLTPAPSDVVAANTALAANGAILAPVLVR